MTASTSKRLSTTACQIERTFYLGERGSVCSIMRDQPGCEGSYEVLFSVTLKIVRGSIEYIRDSI